MKTSWVNGLPADEAKEIEADFKAAARLRERLAEILEGKQKSKQKKGRSEELYKEPGWEFHQADVNGYTRAMDEIISLIK